MNKIFISAVLILITNTAFSESVPPLKLSIKTDKTIYSEGDQIKLTYTVENITQEPVGFFEYLGADFSSNATGLRGEKLEGHNYSYQSMEPHAGDYIKFAPNEKTEEKEEIFGSIVFNEVKDYEIVKGKPMHVAKAILYDGFVISRGFSQIFLNDIKDEGIIISAKYCAGNPNPHDFTKEDCEENEGKNWWDRSDDPFADYDPMAMDKRMYCQDYEKWNQPAFVGCVESEPVEISFDLKMPDDDVVKDYYEDGNLRVERRYENGQLKDLKYYFMGYYPGENSQYYQDSGVYGKRQYENGKLNGEAKDFYKNGQVEYTWNMKDGLLDGKATWYTKDGKLKGEAEYKNNELDGMVNEYLDDGTLSYSANFKNGKIHGTESYFYPTWESIISLNEDVDKRPVKIIGNYKEGMPDGLFQTYNQDDQLQTESIYKEGKVLNIKEYDKMGALVSDIDYNCVEGEKDAYRGSIPISAKMFLKSIEVNTDGVLIEMKDNFREKYKTAPVYVNKRFTDNKLLIPRNADLIMYRLEDIPEYSDLEKYAFIAAYKEEDRQDESLPFQYLYLGPIEGNKATLLIREGVPGQKQKISSYLYIEEQFDSMRKCANN